MVQFSSRDCLDTNRKSTCSTAVLYSQRVTMKMGLCQRGNAKSEVGAVRCPGSFHRSVATRGGSERRVRGRSRLDRLDLWVLWRCSPQRCHRRPQCTRRQPSGPARSLCSFACSSAGQIAHAARDHWRAQRGGGVHGSPLCCLSRAVRPERSAIPCGEACLVCPGDPSRSLCGVRPRCTRQDGREAGKPPLLL
jgi:hypothetical protein